MFRHRFNSFNSTGMDLSEEDSVIHYVLNDGCRCAASASSAKSFENVFFKV